MIDYIILILLMITIIYCFKLNQKIVSLKSAKDDLSVLMHGFDEAIMRAEISISELKQISAETSIEIQKKIDKANYLTNDLSFMSDRAVELADKLEKAVLLSKPSNKSSPVSYKRFLAKDEDEAATNNFNQQSPIVSSTSNRNIDKEYIQREQPNIEELIQKISAIKENTLYGQQEPKSITKKIYKPTIVRQDEFYKSLRKV